MRHFAVSVVFLLCFAGMCLWAGGVVLAEGNGDWKPLFDGKSLAGWHAVGDGKWTVEDGMIVGRADKEKLYGLLVSDKQFGDLTVRFKAKCPTGDSGFYIRTVIEPPDEAHGLQIQVGPPGSGMGGIYESYGRGWIDRLSEQDEAKYCKADDWNEIVITAQGGNVLVKLNGVTSAELKDDPGRPEGHLALQMHSGCKMEVMFKDIEILEKK